MRQQLSSFFIRIIALISMLLTFNAHAAISFLTSANTSGRDSGATLRIPALVRAGDMLITQVVIRDEAGEDDISAPSGWIEIGSQRRSGSVLQSLYYKVAVNADAARNYEWDFSGNGNRRYILGVSVFRGVDTSNPIADENSSSSLLFFNNRVTAPSVETTRLNSYLIAAYALDDGGGNFSPSAGMSEQYDVQTNSNNGLSAMIARELWQPISDTGSRTSIVNSFFGYGIGHLIALNENLAPSINNTLTSCSNLSTISLQFSKALNASTAENINNYSLVSAGGNSVSITGASLASDTVTLTLGETLNDLTPYTVTVNNVTDIGGTSIASDSSDSFSLSCGINCITDNFVGPGDLSNSWSVGNSRGNFGNPRIVENGRLRLTDASGNVATVATLLNQFPGADNRIEVEFDYYAYGGNGADGISVNFSDADITPRAGAYGGSLGYAQQTSIDGFAGGWMGVGIDEYGNFSAANEGKIGGIGRTRDSIAIRGSGAGTNGYPYLASEGPLNPGIDDANSNSANPGHRYKITIDHTAGGGVAMASVSRDTGSGYQLIISEFNVFGKNTDQAPVPENWVVSFTGSTGGSTNIHEIGDLKVCAAQPIQTFVVVDHYDIDVMSPGLTCEGSKVTITAHDINHDPVDQLSDTNINISTTPSVGSIIPSTVTMLAGTSTASFYLQQTSALTNVDIDLTDGNFTDKESTSEDPRISFLDAAFRFYADGSNTDTNPIATQISGKPSNLAPNNQSLALRAVRTNTDTGACEAGLAGPQTVSFAYNCVDPDNCIATQLSITADETKPIAGTSTGNVLAYSNLDMVFDANGSAPFSFNFADAGKIQLHANLNVPEPSPNPDFDPAFTLTGSSNEFVVRPFAFDLGLTGDYQASSSSGTRFVSAGSDFPMTVRAVNWQANDDTNSDGIPDTGSDVANNSSTPNFGQELNGSAQPLAITHTLTLPNPGNVGNLSSTTINTSAGAGFFTAGITDGNPAVNLSWDEVGIIDLDVSLNNYLSAAGANIIGVKTNVGRFYPASFSLISSALTNSCVPAGGDSFSYMSQPGIGVSYELEARNAAGVKTLNYGGGFAKATISLVAENNNEGVDYKPRLSGFGSTSWGSGDYIFSNTGSFNRLASGTPNVLDGPYQDLKIGIQLADNDGNVSPLNGLNMRADTSTSCTTVGNCNALALAGNLDVRFGQLKLNNVFGPETSPLDMMVQTEYFDGTRFVVNTDDSCTVLTLANVGGENEILPASPPLTTNISSGLGIIQFSAAGIGNEGSVNYQYDTITYLPWLNTENNDDGNYADNPFGTVTFGQFRGNDRRLYWREIVR